MPSKVGICLAAALLAWTVRFPALGAEIATRHVKARLISEVGSVGPGQHFWVALEFDIPQGWHTYWRNPGDSGAATSLNWQLPRGFEAGDIVWTMPHRFDLPPLVNYGYAGHAMHLVEMTAAQKLAPGTPVVLLATASWLVCSDICIPESAHLQLHLPSAKTTGDIDPANAVLFARARAELPAKLPAPVRARVGNGQLSILLGNDWGVTLAQIQSMTFFPYTEGLIDYASPQTLSRPADGLELTIRMGHLPPKPDGIRGVLVSMEDRNGHLEAAAFDLDAKLQ